MSMRSTPIGQREPQNGISSLTCRSKRIALLRPQNLTLERMNPPSPTAFAASVTESLSLTDTASAKVRANLSLSHLLSAAILCRSVGRLEAANSGASLGPFWDELQASAVATVLVAVSSLEAFANELFIDHAQTFPAVQADLMAKLWERYESQPILEKLEFAMLLRGQAAIDRGASPYQDIAAVIKLRNALTHYKPEWSDERGEHAKLSKALRMRAVSSPFFPATEPLFPRAWASHGTTVWAVQSVIDFVVMFESRAGLDSRIAPFLPQLHAL